MLDPAERAVLRIAGEERSPCYPVMGWSFVSGKGGKNGEQFHVGPMLSKGGFVRVLWLFTLFWCTSDVYGGSHTGSQMVRCECDGIPTSN